MKANYDAIIVGTGAAGLFAALSLPRTINVCMITKDQLENSDSYLAQGGICTLREEDDFDSFYEDTMRAGHYENNPEAVRIMIEDSPIIKDELLEFGVDFDLDAQGHLAYTREGSHSTFRILHHQDITGKEITSKLIEQVKQLPNVEIHEYHTMIDLLTKDNTCCGVVVKNKEGEIKAINSKVVILATGGLGGLFTNSTNFPHITGDSFAIAIRHGIALQNINYIQIHPTVLYSHKSGRRFLISESVRGEGAYLLNENGERFVDELLPRDKVTEAIRKEMEKFHTDHVYLSVTHMPHDQILHRFPNIYKRCLEEGYDMFTDRIPVTPAQHYLMGGIRASVSGETSMNNLYAVGETACNGVHGANRLASNSLLESLVFARRASKMVEKTIGDIQLQQLPFSAGDYGTDEERSEKNKQLIMEEIRRKDREFYDKWCDNENQRG
jgi:L-aspartate oxidase